MITLNSAKTEIKKIANAANIKAQDAITQIQEITTYFEDTIIPAVNTAVANAKNAAAQVSVMYNKIKTTATGLVTDANAFVVKVGTMTTSLKDAVRTTKNQIGQLGWNFRRKLKNVILSIEKMKVYLTTFQERVRPSMSAAISWGTKAHSKANKGDYIWAGIYAGKSVARLVYYGGTEARALGYGAVFPEMMTFFGDMFRFFRAFTNEFGRFGEQLKLDTDLLSSTLNIKFTDVNTKITDTMGQLKLIFTNMSIRLPKP